MKRGASTATALGEAIKGLEYEQGNIRKLATQLTTVLLENQSGKNPYKLAWDIAKSVGKRVGAKFTPKDVIEELDNFRDQLKEVPEYDMEYFREKGIEGSNTLSHEEHVKFGEMGANSMTNIGDEKSTSGSHKRTKS